MNNQVAKAALHTAFGSEWTALTDAQRDSVAADFMLAHVEDSIGAIEYKFRIGAGNLESYARAASRPN